MPTTIMDSILSAGNTSVIRPDSCHHRACILLGCMSAQDEITIQPFTS